MALLREQLIPSATPAADQWIETLRDDMRLARIHISAAKVKQAHYANKRRRPSLDLPVGSKVLLAIPDDPKGSRPKLGPRFEGPYEVMERLGVVNYRLRLPDGDRRHPVFHENILKEFQESDQFPSRGSPAGGLHVEPPPDPSELPQVERILDQKVIVGPSGLDFVDLLVRWKEGSDNDSWIPEERVAAMAPDLYSEFKQQRQLPPEPLLEGVEQAPDSDSPVSEPAPLLIDWRPTAPASGSGGLLARGTRTRPRAPVPNGSSLPPRRVARRPPVPLMGEDRSDGEDIDVGTGNAEH